MQSAIFFCIHPLEKVLSLIVSECMACGTLAIVSKSLYEVDNKDYDMFFPVDPITNDIEKTLINVIENHQQLANLRSKIRAYTINRLSWKSVSELYLSILNDLIKNGSPNL